MDTSSIAEFNRSRRDSAIGLAMGRLFAIGDIHLSYKSNREALETLEPHPDDGLILAGDGTQHSNQTSTCASADNVISR